MQEIRYRLDKTSGIVTLDIDTGGPVNTIGEQFINDLAAATERSYKDNINGMIIRSLKDTSFLDGANLTEIRKSPSPLTLKHMVLRLHEIFDAMAQSPFPVVAGLGGQTALGGGFELILWTCDRIFATAGAKMGLPEVKVGLFPAAGGLETLKRMVGFETALNLIMEGKVLPATFYEKSDAVQIVPHEEIFLHAEQWIQRNAGIQNRNYDPHRPLPDDLGAEDCRRLIRQARNTYTRCPQRPCFAAALNAMEEGLDLPFQAAVENQVRHFVPLIADVHVQNKIDAFFSVTTVAPKLVTIDPHQALDVSQVAVIGAGLMGQGIAQVCADAGLKVILFDVDKPTAENARRKIGARLEPLVQKGRWPAQRREQALNNIEPAGDYARLENVSLVVETVFEELELKRKILKQVQDVNPQAIFATNTSALPLQDIGRGARRPDALVGMHYFSPVPLMPLLEIVRGPDTSPRALATAVVCGRRQKKTCIVVGDGPGFYTSRTFGAYVVTGFYLVEFGLDPWEVDDLALAAGFPQGPLNIYGTAGGNVIYHAAKFLESRRPAVFSLPRTLTAMFQAGYIGAGEPCFYRDNGEPDPSARRFITANESVSPPDGETAKEMLLLSMVNQAFLCLDEGVLIDYMTMDIGALLGIGFPDCYHGPARYISQKGVHTTRQRLQALYDTYGLHHLKPAREFERLLAVGVDRAVL